MFPLAGGRLSTIESTPLDLGPALIERRLLATRLRLEMVLRSIALQEPVRCLDKRARGSLRLSLQPAEVVRPPVLGRKPGRATPDEPPRHAGGSHAGKQRQEDKAVRLEKIADSPRLICSSHSRGTASRASPCRSA